MADLSQAAFRGIPVFFRTCCQRAARRTDGCNYGHPGRELMLQVHRLVPEGVSQADWCKAVDELREFLNRSNHGAAIEWFRRYYPDCMKLVRKPRYPAFLGGVREALHELRTQQE